MSTENTDLGTRTRNWLARWYYCNVFHHVLTFIHQQLSANNIYLLIKIQQ